MNNVSPSDFHYKYTRHGDIPLLRRVEKTLEAYIVIHVEYYNPFTI